MAANVESLTVTYADDVTAKANAATQALRQNADALENVADAASTTDEKITRATKSLQEFERSGLNPAATAEARIEAAIRKRAAAVDAANRALEQGTISVVRHSQAILDANSQLELATRKAQAWQQQQEAARAGTDSARQSVDALAGSYDRLQASMANGQSAANAFAGIKAPLAGDDLADRASQIASYGQAMDALRAKYNPLFAVSKQYEAELDGIAQAEKVGAISTNEAAAARTRAQQSFEQMNSATTRAATSAGQMGFAVRQLGVQTVQAVSGIASGQPILTTFIQQGHQLVDVALSTGSGFSVLGAAARAIGPYLPIAGVLALTAGLVAGATAGSNYANMMGDLRQSLRATQADYAALADTVDQTSRKVAASSNLTVSAAREAAATIAGAKFFAPMTADLEQLTRDAADFGRVFGGGVQGGAKMIRDGMDDASKAAAAFEAQFGSLGEGVSREIDRLKAAGDAAGAFNVYIGALRAATSGASQDVSSLSRAWTDFQNALSSSNRQLGGVTSAISDFFALQLRGATNIVKDLTAAILALNDAFRKIGNIGNITGAFAGVEPNPAQGQPAAAVTAGTAGVRSLQPTVNTPLGSPTEFIAAMQPVLQGVAKQFGTALSSEIGLAALETGYGKSMYNYNFGNVTAAANYQGATYVGKDGITYRSYGSLQEAATDYASVRSDPRYAAARNTGSNSAAFASAMGNSPYSTSPTYGSSLQGVIAGVQSRAPGIDGQTVDSAKALNAELKEQVANTRAIKDQNLDDALAKVDAQMKAVAASSGTDSAEYQGLVQRQQELNAEKYKNVDAQTAAQRAEESARRGSEGLTAAEQGLNSVLERRRELARDTGAPFGTAEQQAATTEFLVKQSQELDKFSFAQKTAADQSRAMADAYGSGNQAVIDATASQAAYNKALELFPRDQVAFKQAQEELIVRFKDTAQAAAIAKTAQQNAVSRDNLTLIQTESSTLGMNAEQRNRLIAVMKAEQEMHRQFGDILPAEAQAYVDLAGRTADATFAYQQQQQALSDITGAVSSMADTITNDLTQAMFDNGGQAVNWTNALKGLETQFAGLIAKLVVINPLLNALDGGTRSTVSSVGGLLGSLLGGGGSIDTSTASFVVGASAGIGGLVLNRDGNSVDPSELTAEDKAVAGKTATTNSSGVLSYASSAAGIAGLASKAYTYITGENASDILGGVKTYVFDAVGYTPGQSIGSWVSSLIGENAGSTVAGGVADAGAYAGEAAGELGAAGGTTGALGGAASQAGEIGALGSAIDTITPYIPYIGAAIGIITDLATGNLRGAAIMATTTAIGAAVGTIIPGVGTAIGAGVGALIGGLIDTFFPQHPKNPYSFTTVDIVDGHLSVAGQQQQLSKGYSDEARQQVIDLATALDNFDKGVGLRLQNPNGQTVGIFGSDPNGGKNGKPTSVNLMDLFKNLAFEADPNAPDAATNFGIARNAVNGMRFDTFGDLGNEVVKIARFADGMDQLGIQLASVGKDLTDISVASVSLTGNLDDLGVQAGKSIEQSDNPDADPLRVALAHDLPKQSYANVDALSAEIDKVNQFVNATVPGMLNPILTNVSAQVKAINDNDAKYADAIAQALGYGLDTTAAALDQARQKADDLLHAAGRKALDATQQTNRNAIVLGGGDSPDAKFQATFSNFQLQAEQQRDALIKAMTDEYGDAVKSTAYFYSQMNDLNNSLVVQATAMIVQYQRQQYTAGLTINAAVASVDARKATLAGDTVGAATLNADAKAAQERDSYSNQLLDFYGQAYAATAEYQARMTELEQVQQGERLAIVKQAQQQQTDAYKQAAAALTQAANSIRTFLSGFTTSDASPLTPGAKLTAANDRFTSDLSASYNAANDTDRVSAAQQAQTDASDVLTQGRAYYSSASAEYAALFAWVQQALSDLAGGLDAGAAANTAAATGYADGGWVTNGLRGTDSVSANLAGGEYVVRAPRAAQFGHILPAINAGTYAANDTGALAEMRAMRAELAGLRAEMARNTQVTAAGGQGTVDAIKLGENRRRQEATNTKLATVRASVGRKGNP